MEQDERIKTLEAENSKLKSELSTLAKQALKLNNEDIERDNERRDVWEEWVKVYGTEE